MAIHQTPFTARCLSVECDVPAPLIVATTIATFEVFALAMEHFVEIEANVSKVKTGRLFKSLSLM
jgi:hypothetical protein